MTIPEGLSRYPVYMDHHATTPVDPRVVEAMLPYFTEMPGNAASIDHIYGTEANQAVTKAREQISSLINAKPREIIFTSGATESDNLALIGVAQKYADKGKHIITCQTEHKAVLDTCEYLQEQGWDVTYLPVDQQGLLDPDDIRRAIRPDTVLITIMAANNEIGVLAPLAEIGRIAREHELFFHTDATQAVGHIPIDVQAMNIDLLSMSAHKIYGPKGIGALYVRSSRPRVGIAEQIHGGGHERNMRSGTLNVPSIVGFGAALEIAKNERQKEATRLNELRNRLWQGLQENIPCIELNGHPTIRLPHNLSIATSGVESRLVLMRLKNDVAISIGSACTTAKVEPSHVLLSLGYGEERAYSSLRIGLGRENLLEDVDFVKKQLISSIEQLVTKST
jgi:cysteine desulfurase